MIIIVGIVCEVVIGISVTVEGVIVTSGIFNVSVSWVDTLEGDTVIKN